jgi:CheY-like chemotaxis protein
MRLKFNILCFEDNPGALRRTFNVVEKHLDQLGFVLFKHPVQENGKNLTAMIEEINKKKMDVDLILMDYKLSDKDKGNDLIKKIRDHELYTDVIFYSRDVDFDKDIDEMRRLEGVFFSDRDALPMKAVKVIENLLKKSLDLANFRGLVMAETSELDEIMFQIVKYLLDGNIFRETAKKKNTIKERYKKFIEEEIQKIDGISMDGNAGTQELLLKVGAYHRARAVTRLVSDVKKQSENNDPKLKEIADKIGDIKLEVKEYRSEIIQLRNLLAHVKEEKSLDGRKFLRSTLRGEDFVFDEAAALATRRTLKKYFTILTGIYKAVTGEDWD